MGQDLDTATLLAECAGLAKSAGRVIFLAHRAADGWLGFDLTGGAAARFASARDLPRSIEIRRGGPEHPERVFALYALELDPESCGGLRIPSIGGARFGLGGDVRILLRASRGLSSRLLFFRGSTVIPRRSRSVPAGASIARATPELVFEAPRETLWEEVRRLEARTRLGRRLTAPA